MLFFLDYLSFKLLRIATIILLQVLSKAGSNMAFNNLKCINVPFTWRILISCKTKHVSDQKSSTFYPPPKSRACLADFLSRYPIEASWNRWKPPHPPKDNWAHYPQNLNLLILEESDCWPCPYPGPQPWETSVQTSLMRPLPVSHNLGTLAWLSVAFTHEQATDMLCFTQLGPWHWPHPHRTCGPWQEFYRQSLMHTIPEAATCEGAGSHLAVQSYSCWPRATVVNRHLQCWLQLNELHITSRCLWFWLWTLLLTIVLHLLGYEQS